jgi:O-acetyl-ADP-ribose deacetylase
MFYSLALLNTICPGLVNDCRQH